MSRKHRVEVEAFRKRFRKDVQEDAVRERAEYVREFPGLESEIEAELAVLRESVETVRAGSNDDSMTANVVAPDQGIAKSGAEEDGEARIGRYRLEKELGRGGQGCVYLARDAEIGLEVALKVLNAGQALSTEARLRFKGEAEKAARLNHPNIARVHEWGEHGGLPFIAMEFVRGETLADHIRRSAQVAEKDAEVSELFFSLGGNSGESELSAAEAQTERRSPAAATSTAVDRRAMLEIAELIESAARGLHEAHERGLVHRDIKPANLIVAPGRGLVILDFGMAHDDAAEGAQLTMTGDVLGTPAYMSPEQLTARRGGIDRRTDVFALGVTLFECLALQRPFQAASRQQLFQEILTREAPDIRKLNRRVPEDLAVIVHHALEKAPEQRYPTALDMAEDLRRYREHKPIVARPVGPITRTWRWAQRKPATAGLLATVFVALATIAVVVSLNNRDLNRLNTNLERTTRVAEANATEARENERRAQEEAAARAAALRDKTAALEREQEALAEKTSALSEYERMADTRRLANARAAADEMWPVHPDLVPRLAAWREKYAPLFSRLDGHRRALEALRAKAPAYTDEERKRDFARELDRIAHLEVGIPKFRELVEASDDVLSNREANAKIANYEIELADLRERVKGRGSWDFGDDVDLQFRHDTLARLVSGLSTFTAENSGVVSSVAERIALSRRIARETLENRSAVWDETIARIASNPRYGGLTLSPQLGLIPLG
ncbi:MAG: serine/threonine protein kinase, partial [Planctomycetes bacterium]|nr:serine/threonine protein kinase [Planctomycetota bacterium]